MSNAAERASASVHHSTTSEPVVFFVTSPRARAVVAAIPYELQDMYVRAWRDAIGAVMDDCGWTYEAQQDATVLEVERVRTGRPRVIHGTQIDAQLMRAIKAVDDVLGSILINDEVSQAALNAARRSEPVAFQWRITESYSASPDSKPQTMELLGSSYIDLAHQPQSGARA